MSRCFTSIAVGEHNVCQYNVGEYNELSQLSETRLMKSLTPYNGNFLETIYCCTGNGKETTILKAVTVPCFTRYIFRLLWVETNIFDSFCCNGQLQSTRRHY